MALERFKRDDTGRGEIMKFIAWLLMACVGVLLGMFGLSYVRNPDVPPMQHAQAVGFVLANPMSGNEWRSLACPHRRAVADLVTMSLAPKLCGLKSDGGAVDRAKKFKTQGQPNCWALFEALSARAEVQYGQFYNGARPRNAAAEDVCNDAARLLKVSR
jgi:hypothetical protein